MRAVTTYRLWEMKQRREKIAMLTSYDYSMARIVDAAGVDVILVGDSAANVMAGYETTVPITLDMMIYHARSVARAVRRALVVVDLPFGTYQGNSKVALESAVRIMKETEADAVKMEGGEEVLESVQRILSAGIPVMGHLGLTPQSIHKFGTYNVASSAPFRRIPYNTAMETYGSDKPDLRIDLTCKNVSELFVASEFEAFKGQTVKMVPISDCALTRKQVEKLLTDCEVQSGSKAYWFKVDENGQLAGGIAKFVAPVEAELGKIIDLKPGTLVLATAGQYATKSVGVLIKTFGAACENHFDKERYEFCWIVDFPMYEIGDESGELEFCHNPFSMPNGGMEVLLKAERGEIDPLDIYANQYDLVCNGVELSSGAVRNHDPEIMIKAFELVRLGEEDVKKKFPAMYNAFCYGAPPHAGIAPGVDRMVMLLAGESSIREIIPFPMNKNAQDIMMGAPSTVEQKQLDELHIAIVGEVEKDD